MGFPWHMDGSSFCFPIAGGSEKIFSTRPFKTRPSEELAKPLVLPFQLSGAGYWLSGQAARNQ
jgi:hypothetical protein